MVDYPEIANEITNHLLDKNKDKNFIFQTITQTKTNLVKLKEELINSNLSEFKEANQVQLNNFKKGIGEYIRSGDLIKSKANVKSLGNTLTRGTVTTKEEVQKANEDIKRFQNFKNFLKSLVLYLYYTININTDENEYEEKNKILTNIFKENFSKGKFFKNIDDLKLNMRLNGLQNEARKPPSASDAEDEGADCYGKSPNKNIPVRCKSTICLKQGKFIDTSSNNKDDDQGKCSNNILIDFDSIKGKKVNNVDILNRFINSIPKENKITIDGDEIDLDQNLLQNLILNLRLLTLIPSKNLEEVTKNLFLEYEKYDDNLKNILTNLYNTKTGDTTPLERLMEKAIAAKKKIQYISSNDLEGNQQEPQSGTESSEPQPKSSEPQPESSEPQSESSEPQPEEASTQTPTVPASGKDDEITMIGGRKTKYRRFINKKSLRKKTNITKRKNIRKKLTKRKKLRPKKTLRKKRHFSKKKRKNYKGGNQNFCPASQTPFLNAQANNTKNLFSEIQANRRWA